MTATDEMIEDEEFYRRECGFSIVSNESLKKLYARLEKYEKKVAERDSLR